MKNSFTLGLDFGTNSVRCVLCRVADGEEVGVGVAAYQEGENGVILDWRDPDLARQHPRDYERGLYESVRATLAHAQSTPGFSPQEIIGIGVDATGSTPLPLNADGVPLAYLPEFEGNINALAWLWKDHTAHEEALLITRRSKDHSPDYTTLCGGVYSPEWMIAKAWHCLRIDRRVFDAAATWAEASDWIPALITGTLQPSRMKRGRCPAGHKALYSDSWGGLPSTKFLAQLQPELAVLRERLYVTTSTVDEPAGQLTAEWAEKLGLPEGIPVAVGALDGHMGAIGAGVRPGMVVNIFGTSSVYLSVTPGETDPGSIPGICGVVKGSILPGYFGIEAGQAATGDLFNWWVQQSGFPPQSGRGHAPLTAEAEYTRPGESGLLALDWNNGNRCLLVDPRLTGLLVGQTLQTSPAEIYRALIEATAFGARMILERFAEHGLQTDSIVNAGGIPHRSDLVMQVYADVTGIPQRLSGSAQTCALGAAMCGATVAGPSRGGYSCLPDAQKAMAAGRCRVFVPQSQSRRVYDRIYSLYRDLHDAFGTPSGTGKLFHVMKELLDIRDEVRAQSGIPGAQADHEA